jgi:SAM-dependent methyltransferase
MDASQGRDGSPGFNRPQYAERVTAIYRDSYAARYGRSYVEPWGWKHQLNLRNLAQILDGLPFAQPLWLDLACGQAWHFARFAGRACMYGLDLSPAQLARAQLNAPTAAFVCADMVDAPFLRQSFDLVTIFWAGYC